MDQVLSIWICFHFQIYLEIVSVSLFVSIKEKWMIYNYHIHAQISHSICNAIKSLITLINFEGNWRTKSTSLFPLIFHTVTFFIRWLIKFNSPIHICIYINVANIVLHPCLFKTNTDINFSIQLMSISICICQIKMHTDVDILIVHPFSTIQEMKSFT